jgi:predicted GH43/DUF377 family glycosyl hydrolase
MRWEKISVIFDPTHYPDRPSWMHGYAQAPNSLIFDDFVRVYFCCRPLPDNHKQFVSYCAFVDLDRNDLRRVIGYAKKPVLSLGGLGAFDEHGTYPVSFVRDGSDIIAIYGGWSRCESVPFNISLGYARSSDGGITFKKYGPGPILSHSLLEPFVVTSPKIRKFGDKWVLAYTAGRKWFHDENGAPEIIYKLRIAFSSDGLNWTKLNKDIILDKIGENEAQACPDIIFVNGLYHMFFCYRYELDFRTNPSRSYRIGYATSKDLINWDRDDSRVNLNVTAGAWDAEMIAYPNILQLDGCTYMFYGGNGNGKTGFGLAKLVGDF